MSLGTLPSELIFALIIQSMAIDGSRFLLSACCIRLARRDSDILGSYCHESPLTGKQAVAFRDQRRQGNFEKSNKTPKDLPWRDSNTG